MVFPRKYPIFCAHAFFFKVCLSEQKLLLNSSELCLSCEVALTVNTHFTAQPEVKLSGVGETVVITVHDQSFPSPNLKQQTVSFFCLMSEVVSLLSL